MRKKKSENVFNFDLESLKEHFHLKITQIFERIDAWKFARLARAKQIFCVSHSLCLPAKVFRDGHFPNR